MEQSTYKYPIGIQDFNKIRTDNYVYVDKTDLIYKLASEGNYYFLSRPRRFGKSYDSEFKTYSLGFPNREVREGFIKYLVPFYTPKNNDKSSFSIDKFVKEIRSGQANAFMQRLEAFFANGDYALMGNKELYFQNAMYVFFTLMGLYVEVERHTVDGRMDILVQTSDYIYIFELKIDKDADTALKQIEDKGYAKPFASDKRKLFKIGINFSTEKRKIDDWKIEE